MSEKKREWTKKLPPPGAYWLDFPGADNYILGLVLKDSGPFQLVTCNCGYDGEQAKALGVRYSPIEPRSKQDDAGSTLPRSLGSHSQDTDQDGETLEERVIALESRVADALHRIKELEPKVWRLDAIEYDSAKTYEPDPNVAAVDKVLQDSANARKAEAAWSSDVPKPGAYWVQSNVWEGVRAGNVFGDVFRCVSDDYEQQWALSGLPFDARHFLFSPIVLPDGLDEGCQAGSG